MNSIRNHCFQRTSSRNVRMRFAVEISSDLLRVLHNKSRVSETMSRSDLCLGSSIVCQTTRTIICVISDRFFLPSDKGKFRISQCSIFILITPIRRADFAICSVNPVGMSTMSAFFRNRRITVRLLRQQRARAQPGCDQFPIH